MSDSLHFLGELLRHNDISGKDDGQHPYSENARNDILGLLEQARIEVLNAGNVGQIDRQDEICQSVWNVAIESGDLEYKACAEWCSGLAFLYREQSRAAQHFERAKDFFDGSNRDYESARIAVNLILLYCQLGRYEEAEETTQWVIATLNHYPDYRNWPSVYLNASLSAQYLGRFDVMLKRARLAEKIAAQIGHEEDVIRARINQALAFRFIGNLVEARNLLDGILCDLKKKYRRTEIDAQARLILALVGQGQNQLFDALINLYEARQIFKEIGQHIDEATCAIDEAALYNNLNMPRDAMRCFSLAAIQFEKAGLPSEWAEALCGVVKLALFDDPQPHKARTVLSKLLAQPVKPKYIELVCEVYARHPLILKRELPRSQACKQVWKLVAELESIGALPQTFEAEYVALLLEDKKQIPAKGTKALELAHVRGFRGVERKFHQLIASSLKSREAHDHLVSAVNIFEQDRAMIGFEELKANALMGSASVYSELIETELALNMPQEAAQTLLRAKGGIWVDLAPSVDAKLEIGGDTPDPQWMLLREAEILSIDKFRNAKSEEAKREARFHLETARENLASYARQRPIPKRGREMPVVKAVRERLGNKQVVVDFCLTPKKVLACMYDNSDAPPTWLDIGHPKRIAEILSEFRAGLWVLQFCAPDKRLRVARAQLESSGALLDALRQRLLQPVLDWVANSSNSCEEIILSPDGFLHEIPWGGLFADTDWERIGRQFRLSMSPARLALPSLENSTEISYVLGCAGDPPLAHVEREVRAIAALLPNAQLVFPATEDHLNFRAPPKILHIAAHGSLDPYAPLLSRIQIGKPGFLLADALRLPLAGTQLVALSGCETAGLPERGGASMALSGAFMSAGARSVLAGLWQVDDVATAELMGRFYSGLARDKPSHAALQYARNAMRGEGWTHPFYWAGFQIME